MVSTRFKYWIFHGGIVKTINARALTKAAERIYDLAGGKCAKCPCEENNVRFCWGPDCVVEIQKHLIRRAKDEYYREKHG